MSVPGYGIKHKTYGWFAGYRRVQRTGGDFRVPVFEPDAKPEAFPSRAEAWHVLAQISDYGVKECEVVKLV